MKTTYIGFQKQFSSQYRTLAATKVLTS